jgi:hypothetical protein
MLKMFWVTMQRNSDEAEYNHSSASYIDDESSRRIVAIIEVGVTVGTSVGIILAIFFLFYFRHVEERRKVTLWECMPRISKSTMSKPEHPHPSDFTHLGEGIRPVLTIACANKR